MQRFLLLRFVRSLQQSPHRPLERRCPQGVDHRIGTTVEDCDGVGQHAQEDVVCAEVEQLHLPPNHVWQIADGQNEGHDGDGNPPLQASFTLKRIYGPQFNRLPQILLEILPNFGDVSKLLISSYFLNCLMSLYCQV